jgi:mannose-6-phosphate isomerase-like protein (cupin superfamily)
MVWKFSLETAAPLGRDSVSGRIYSTMRDFDRLSAVHVETREAVRHGLIKNIACDRLYLVLSGSGTFRVDGEDQSVEASDIVIIPRGTPYDYWGRMSLLLVHAPANIDEADINLEDPPFPL